MIRRVKSESEGDQCSLGTRPSKIGKRVLF